MKKTLFTSALAFMMLFQSCTITTSNGSDPVPVVTIKDQVAQGQISATKKFTLKKAYVKYESFFNEMGYKFRLYDIDALCDESKPSPISFFIKKNEVGTYSGQGPFMYDASTSTSTSFFGCDVIITKVTATTIEGKVKGGDFKEKFIEGSFVATICK